MLKSKRTQLLPTTNSHTPLVIPDPIGNPYKQKPGSRIKYGMTPSAKSVTVRILGIDPGTATTGWGVVDYINNQPKSIAWGNIETAKEDVTPQRLLLIYRALKEIIKTYNPRELAMEAVFFARNAKTAIKVGQAQGVMFMASQEYDKRVIEYSPATIKKILTGNGRAEKTDVQKAVRVVLGASVKSPKHKRTHFDNSADALAVAICHLVKLNGYEVC